MTQYYIHVPGNRTHELPPLLVESPQRDEEHTIDLLDVVMDEVVEMMPDLGIDQEIVEQRKFDLAASMAAQYQGLLARWQWGNSILEWVRQCEITFEAQDALRRLLHPDIWPHASRSSFVTLLTEKSITVPNSNPQQAVGLRLTFREPPPLRCCSNQFLFYLNSTVANSAYQSWAHLNTEQPALLPPDRFHFEVIDVDQE